MKGVYFCAHIITRYLSNLATWTKSAAGGPLYYREQKNKWISVLSWGAAKRSPLRRNRKVNPYYRKKDIAGGDRNNPLGTRWIGFDAEDTDGRTYGVHGTNKPESIGGYVTQGCIRLPNELVEVLFDHIPIGTRIWIVNTDKSFEELGREKGIMRWTKAAGKLAAFFIV
jgi:hypothetical protein